MAQPITRTIITNRLDILKSGYRSFINTIKTPLSNEHRWLLEVVCLHEQPVPLPKSNESAASQVSIYDKAEYFLENFLWNYQTKINLEREEWVRSKKGVE